jgi:acetylornithine deacetylase/succinyl-diaminopimelate desuccinylase-like protein
MKKIILTCTFIFVLNSLYSQRDYELLSIEEGTKNLNLFKEFLSIPNDNKNKNEIIKNIDWARVQLNKFKFKTKTLETSSLPLLLATRTVNSNLPTIAFYMHLDGQSVDPTKWNQNSPWHPVIKKFNGKRWVEVQWEEVYSKNNKDLRIFARSSSDDKGPFMMFLTSLKILELQNEKPKFNLKLILDFEEEKSSPGLPEAVKKYKKELLSDMLLILDGPMHSSMKPTLVFGNRGISSITLKTFGPKTPQHSGHYGNFIPNPALRLSQILASMKSEDGKVLIPGFYDGIDLSEEVKSIFKNIPSEEDSIKMRTKIKSVDLVANSYQESLQYPSLNIRGLQSGWVGTEARTIIPATATAEMDIRLVLESDPEKLIESIRNHIIKLGYTIFESEPTDQQRMNNDKVIQMKYKISYPAFRTPINSKQGEWLKKILYKNFKIEPVLIRTSGGSVPISPFVNELGIPAIGIPTVNLDNNQHSPNENLRLGNYFQGIETFVKILLEPYK